MFFPSAERIIHICMRVEKQSHRPGSGAWPVRCMAPLLLLSAIWILLACATAHAILSFTAPSEATAGNPFTVTVDVLYQGKRDTVINSAIHFTSSDPAAILPPDYYFTPADAGSHTWSNGFTLSTPGKQTISGQIHDASGINGSVTVAVSP
jgi:hypothetical protein